MAGRIHFSSGKTLEITEREFLNISPKLNGKGIKTQKTKSGHVIPLNSMTMEYIEHIPEVADEAIDPEPVLANSAPVAPVVEEPAVEEPVKMKRKTSDEILADMMEKSNCKHEPEKLELYIQHTAKGVRYFPVCSFCGKREKYVSESKIVNGEYAGTPHEKWTEEHIANATPWMEK